MAKSLYVSDGTNFTQITAADVGAASSTHNHTKAQVGLSNVDNTADNVKNVATAVSLRCNGTSVGDSTDWTSIATSGIYQVNISTFANAKNYPTVASGPCYGYGDLWVENFNSHIVQIYYSHQGDIFMRQAWNKTNGIWNYAAWQMAFTSKNKPSWSDVQNKPSTYAPSSHTHDDRYYTESEADTKLNAKLGAVNVNGYYGLTRPDGNDSDWIRTTSNGLIPYKSGSASSLGTSSWHFNNAYIDTVYGSLSGTAARATKLAATQKGNATQPVYINSDGVPTATTYTLGKSVPSNAVFTDTNTWRGVQNNLTSTATDQSLAANQGKVLNDKINNTIVISSTQPSSNDCKIWIKI